MAELLISLRSDDRASQALDRTNKRLKDLGRSAESAGRQVQKGTQRADRSLTGLADRAGKVRDAFSQLRSAIQVVFAGAVVRQAFRGASDLTAAFAFQEAAVRRLSVAMRNAGAANRDLLREQTELAAQFQKTTTFGDEQIITTQALLTSFGLAGSAMRDATRASLDLSAALDVDLRTAALLLGKAFKGDTGELKTYGIVLDQSIPKNERFAATIRAINAQFGGAAQALTETYSGRIQQLSNEFGDLKETLGQELVPVFNTWISALRRGISTLDEFVAGNDEEIAGHKGAIAALEERLRLANARAAAELRHSGEISDAAQREIDLIQKGIAVARQKAQAEAATREAEKEAAAEAVRRRAEEAAAASEAAANADARAKAEQDFLKVVQQLDQEFLQLRDERETAEAIRIEREKEERIAALQELQRQGQLTVDVVDAAITQVEANATAKLRKLAEESDFTMESLRSAANGAAKALEDRFSSAFAQAITEGKSFGESLKGVFREVADTAVRELARVAVQRTLFSAAGGALNPFAAVGLGAFGLFAGGGFQRGTRRVPGPLGAPRAVVAHGGEEIAPAGGASRLRASQGLPGAPSGPVVVNVSMYIQVANLAPEERRRVLEAMSREIRDATDSGRIFASEVFNAGQRQQGRAS